MLKGYVNDEIKWVAKKQVGLCQATFLSALRLPPIAGQI